MTDKVRVAILGASGYTGSELVRMLCNHPRVEIVALTANRYAGQPFGDVYPHLAYLGMPDLIAIDDVNWPDVDFVFCALPHGTTQEVIAGLPAHVKVCDLSADFRLFDPESYALWYGHEHMAPELQKEVVYGVTELKRDAVAKARVVANPGCYPTSIQLPLVPLIKAGLIETDAIISDSKSGMTGAGRSPKEAMLYAEVAEGINAYGVGGHRHSVEIDQELSEAAGEKIQISFTPHLMPMARGILSTIYVKLAPGKTLADLRAKLEEAYKDEFFVEIAPEGRQPATRFVRGSNRCMINLFKDNRDGHAIIVSVIDNLIKGASGQAIQNMNAMLGFDEKLGLEQAPMFP